MPSYRSLRFGNCRIDKAPRDLPNDVLDEIENLAFTVRETGRRFAAD